LLGFCYQFLVYIGNNGDLRHNFENRNVHIKQLFGLQRKHSATIILKNNRHRSGDITMLKKRLTNISDVDSENDEDFNQTPTKMRKKESKNIVTKIINRSR
jgi:hypothetical protein